MPPIGQEAGAASHRKIGGDLQGEPRLPVDAKSGCGWQGAKMPGRGMQTLKGEGDNSGKAGIPVERAKNSAQNWPRSGDQIGAWIKGRG